MEAEPRIPLEHPGVILKAEFLEPLKVTAYRVCKSTGIPAMTLSEILRGKRSISPNTALRLAKYFGVTDGYFVRLQAHYDTEKEKEKIQNEIEAITPLQLPAVA